MSASPAGPRCDRTAGPADADEQAVLREVVEAIPQGIAVWDSRLCLAAWNRRFLTFVGLSRGEVWPGRPAAELLDVLARQRAPDERAARELARDLMARLRSGRPDAAEETIGDGRILEVRQSPLGTGGVVVTYTDVTERRRAESALVQSELRYRGVVDTQKELVCRFDPDGWLTFVNHAFCRYLGSNRSRLLGRSVFALTGEADAKALQRPLADLAKGRVREAKIVTEIRPATGRDAWQEWTAQATRGEEGHLEFQLVGRDVSELKAAQREAVQLAKLASLGQIVAGMAHELNQPLNTIAMAADNALIACECGEADHSYVISKLRTVHDHAMRMGEIIRYLRAFNRPEPGTVEVVPLAGVVESGLRLAARELEINGITLERHVPPDVPPVRCNPVALEQVIVNLLANARDAILERRRREPAVEARVVVTLAAGHEGKAMVRVRDSGGGVPATIRDRIFDPLFTTKTVSARESSEGLGLGLSICYRSVVQMGGQIGVADTAEGAEFWIEFPAARRHPGTDGHG